MLIGTSVTDTVSYAGSEHIATVFGTRGTALESLLSRNMFNVTPEYILLKNELIAFGLDLTDPGYVRLFQIITELVIINLSDGYALDTEGEIIMKELLLEELTRDIHTDHLVDVDIPYDTLVDKMSDVYLTLVGRNEYAARAYIDRLYIPINWQYHSAGISVTIGGYCDA